MEAVSPTMQAFVSSLTAALLFIHAVLGCCWHHAHHSTAVVSRAAHCCHHHQHSNDSKRHEKPCQGEVECEGTCIYVVPQKVKIEAPQWIAFDLLALLPSIADHQIVSARSCEVGWPPSDIALPLRTHLLHQVLLN